MLKYQDIRRVHLEVTTHCNARCPLCARNLYGADHNDGYPLTSLSLNDIQQIFPVDFVKQLRTIYFGGNFGDFIMAKDIIGILEYFRNANPVISITGSTNGGIRPKEFWEELARLKMTVTFCIDGLSDTHSLYRVDTDYNVVIQNAKSFIDAGGNAIWTMTALDHNADERTTAKMISEQMGFVRYILRDYGRNNGPVFSRNGEFTHYIGEQRELRYYAKNQIIEFNKKNIENMHYRDVTPSTKFNCEVTQMNSIYIDASGDVYPCCYIGHYPKTYNTARMYGASQLSNLVSGIENNALTHSVEHAVGWFNKVSERFSVPTFAEGRLYICHEHCGVK